MARTEAQEVEMQRMIKQMAGNAPPLQCFTVGVFPFDERQTRFNAYTTWYNPSWSGCCEHKVEAVNGTAAKKIAIQEHKDRCVDRGKETEKQ